MSKAVDALRAGAERLDLGEGRALRLLSAQETLEARREGALLAKDGTERALCANAALLTRALVGAEDASLYESGSAVLQALTAQEIGRLARIWAKFDRAENPTPSTEEEGERWLEELREDREGRLRWKVLRTFGALPTEERARAMKERDYLWCALQLLLDREEELDRLCPTCRAQAMEERCPVCGAPTESGEGGQNAAFDQSRYEAMCRGEKP